MYRCIVGSSVHMTAASILPTRKHRTQQIIDKMSVATKQLLELFITVICIYIALNKIIGEC